ncbi:MAG: hypothetical protein KKA81_11440 [Bacteroidetes bacterium]|nr:hypothetical protein [Bacteroidota bacterium]
MGEIKMFYLRGRSGKHYRFYSFTAAGQFKREGGVYIIARRTDDNDKSHHDVIDIGETEDLSTLNDYILTNTASDEDANCICARLEGNPLKRREAIDDLKIGITSGLKVIIAPPGSEF